MSSVTAWTGRMIAHIVWHWRQTVPDLWSCGGKGPVSETTAHPTDNECVGVSAERSCLTRIWIVLCHYNGSSPATSLNYVEIYKEEQTEQEISILSSCMINCEKKIKERKVLSEIHLRTTGRHLSMGSHSVICHPTEVTAPPSPQPGRLVLDLSTP